MLAHLKMWFQRYTMELLQMAQPPTFEAFLGHLSLWNEVWNVSRMKGLALTFPKMLWKSRIWPKIRKCWKLPTFTNPSSGGPDKWPRSLLLPPLLNLLKVGNSQYCITHCITHCSWEQPYLIFVIFWTPPHFLACKLRARKVRKFAKWKLIEGKLSLFGARFIIFCGKVVSFGARLSL